MQFIYLLNGQHKYSSELGYSLGEGINVCAGVCPLNLCVAGCCCPALWSSPGWPDSQQSVAAH